MGDDDWTAIADEWAKRWGAFAGPVRSTLLQAAEIGAGTRLLDVGCGSGELLRLAADRGAATAGADPSPGMLAIAARTAPERTSGSRASTRCRGRTDSSTW